MAVVLLGTNLDFIDHVVHAEDTPGIALGHLAQIRIWQEARQADLAMTDPDPDLARVDEGIFLQDRAHGLLDPDRRILLRRFDCHAIDDIADARHPPGHDSGKPLAVQAGNTAVQRNDAFADFDVDMVTSLGRIAGNDFVDRLIDRLEGFMVE